MLEEAHEEQQAEQERLTDFFEHAGIKAGLWPVFMQLVRSAAGKDVVCGNQSLCNGLLLYSRPRKGAAYQPAGVVCRTLGARRWPADLTSWSPPGLAVAYRGSRPEPAESRRPEPGHQALRLRTHRPPTATLT
nr:hypothetical protein [Streptomyces sp. LBUM 1477]